MGGIQHEAQSAAAGIKGLESALGAIMPLVAAITGVATIFETFRKSFAQAAEREQAGQQFEAIAGGAEKAAHAMEELEKISAETATDFPELAQGAKRLMEAGLSADEAAEATGRLQKIALNTGSSFEELADIYARVTTKQEVSLKDLTKLAAAGIPGIADIAKQFKNLEKATKDSDNELEHSNQIFKDQYELAEKNIGAINSFGQKTGLLAEAFRQFQQSAYRNVGRVSFGGMDLGEKYAKQFSQGLKQISQETGVTERDLGNLMDKGKLGFEDLIQAAQRFREEQEKQRETGVQTKRYEDQKTLLEAQRNLLGQVGEAIQKATDPGGMFANVTKVFDIIAGKWRQIMLDIDQSFEAFGAPLIRAFQPVLSLIHDQVMPKLQEAATTFGAALENAVQTGDWSGVADAIANALTSPEVIGAITAFSDALGKALSKTITSEFNQIAEKFSSPQKILDSLTKAGLNPATKEFWMGGLGGTPVTPATTPATMPTPAPAAATQQPAGGDKVATEATLKAAVDLLMKLPLLFTVGA